MTDTILQFIRQRDYQLVKELGQGACGKTVLLHDAQIGANFVCKKYVPYAESEREALFQRFVEEIKLLYELHHRNVVRVYGHYLYTEQLVGYIIMEYVEGQGIEEYLSLSPDRANDIFLQTIQGFRHLEESGILHRDVRRGNLLVRNDGVVKIIDFGFGKRIFESADFDKSVSLNWWCEVPPEFAQGIYNFRTEIYFIGKLFEQILENNRSEDFGYRNILRKMCQRNPDDRPASFSEIEIEAQSGRIKQIGFSEEQISVYRAFADHVTSQLVEIDSAVKYSNDPEKLVAALEDALRRCMLEERIPDAALVIKPLFWGSFRYRQTTWFPVEVLAQFVRLLKGASDEHRRIVIANLHGRLDAVNRAAPKREVPLTDDEIPF